MCSAWELSLIAVTSCLRFWVESSDRASYNHYASLASRPPCCRYPQKAAHLEFLHFPIYDLSVASDESVMLLVERLRTELAAGRRIFMHCRGGHGRTGTIVSILLGLHHGITAYEALELCQAYHDTRGA